MTTDVAVRRARLEDAEGFVRAHEEAWNATLAPVVGRALDELAPFKVRVDQYRASIDKASDQAAAWVAERSGEIVGIAVALRADPESVELRDLYLTPAAWGTGTAAVLMAAAIDSVRGQAKDAILWVGAQNGRARHFYEREGWAPDGESRVSQLGPVELRYRRSLAS